ncbi:MAG: glycosyltransferase [Rhodospirillales bacterium]
MGRPAISFVMPSLNGQNRLPEIIGDLAASGVQDGEIIIVDDGSAEPPTSLALGSPDMPVQVIVNGTNIGPGASRNKAIAASEADYVCFVDDDDMVEAGAFSGFDPDALDGADIVLMRFLDENNGVMSNDVLVDGLIGEPAGHALLSSYRQSLLRHEITPLQCQAYLFRRAMLLENDVRFPPTWLAEDQVFLTKALLAAETAAVWPTPYYRYQTRPASLKTSASAERCHDFCRALDDLLRFLAARDVADEMLRTIARQSAERLVRLFCIRFVALDAADQSDLVRVLTERTGADASLPPWIEMPADMLGVVEELNATGVTARSLTQTAGRLLFSGIPATSGNNFIYCCGPMGRAVRAHLARHGMTVSGFLDDNAAFKGQQFEGCPVFDLDDAQRNGALEGASVIIANPQPNIADKIGAKLSSFRDRHAVAFDIVVP